MRLIVAIATTGRTGILADTVCRISGQTRLPDLLILSVAAREDVDLARLEGLPFPCQIILGERGLTHQRNRILEQLTPEDIVLFLDDDFLMAPDYLAQTRALFERRPDVVMATGRVLADGILGPGWTHDEGARHLQASQPVVAGDGISEIYNGYGCNMALRARPVVAHGLRFDERLPLYGWLEDVDFSRALAGYGRIVRAAAMAGVHLGTKTGRSRGVPLGYSQIANPLYLVSKGTMQGWRAYRLMARNIAMNLARSLRPEPWVDRRGRLRGNLLALRDMLRGRISPTRILELG